MAVKGLGTAAYTASTAYAAASHTHNYAGSSSAGGAATSANQLNPIVCNSGSSSLANIQNAFNSLPKSVPLGLRLEHGSHSIAFGWLLNGYAYAQAYGGFFVSDYSTPTWIGVNQGSWSASTILTSTSSLNAAKLTGTVPSGCYTNTTYSVATQSANGLMSAADKKKLDGVATSANNYSHPTGAGNNHIPSGGSSGQFLKWSSSGVAVWAADNNTNTWPDAMSQSEAETGTATTQRSITAAVLKAAILKHSTPAKSLAANGYVKLDSGLIIQWGSITSTSDGYNQSTTFPTSFSSDANTFGVFAQHRYATASSAHDWAFAYITITSFTKSNVTFGYLDKRVTTHYIAIGQ